MDGWMDEYNYNTLLLLLLSSIRGYMQWPAEVISSSRLMFRCSQFHHTDSSGNWFRPLMCTFHFALRGFTLISWHSCQNSYVNVVGSVLRRLPEELSWDGHANLQVHAWKVLFVIFNSGDAESLQNILGKEKKKYHTVILLKACN